MKRISAIFMTIVVMLSFSIVAFGEEVEEVREYEYDDFLNHQLENISVEKGKDIAYDMISGGLQVLAPAAVAHASTSNMLIDLEDEPAPLAQSPELTSNVNVVSVTALVVVAIIFVVLIVFNLNKSIKRKDKKSNIIVVAERVAAQSK